MPITKSTSSLIAGLLCGLVSSAAAGTPGKSKAVLRETDQMEQNLVRAKQSAMKDERHCQQRVLNDIVGDIDALNRGVTGRVLEMVRTDLKWMSRLAADECGPGVSGPLRQAYVAAERALLAFDLEAEHMSDAERATALKLEGERAKQEAEKRAEADKAKTDAMGAAKEDAAAAEKEAMLAKCWDKDDPGCNVERDGHKAMDKAEFDTFLKTLVKNRGDSDRGRFIESMAGRTWLTTKQLGKVIRQLRSESRRQDALKALAPHVVDPKNGYTLSEEFRSRTRSREVVELMNKQVE